MTADTLGKRFVHTAKAHWSALAVADSTGKALTFGRALTASLMLAKWMRRKTAGEQTLGILLPASVGGALANIGATLEGRVPVNLNFTAGPDAVAYAIRQCGITTVLTSRAFLSKAQIEPFAGMVFLEDIMKEISRVESLRTLAIARVLSATAICRRFLPRDVRADSLATIIFSSGSTGIPKGVMLTHRNVLANIDSVRRAFHVTEADVMLGVLPLFHSFGFTVTLWLPLAVGFAAAYHPNPTDAKTIGELAERYGATMLVSTPTFSLTYVRKIKPEQFARLRIAMVGAEKLREPIAQAFKDRFGVQLLEGYGCTEMSPVVAANTSELASGASGRSGWKAGSVGRPLPGVDAKVIDLDTREGPLVGKEGLLLVRGDNMMAGYLNDPNRTKDVLCDGWYVTGDIARVDEDGFIHITDRVSRFSKIGGEMVPHMKVEESIASVLGEGYSAAVTAVDDPNRGERLVAFYTDPKLKPSDIWQRLSEDDLPKLWVPKKDDIHYVEALPTLGTGKMDLRRLRQLAAETSQS